MIPAVKICGLMRPEDIEASIAAGARYLGFIVEAPSKRRLSVKAAARLSRPAKAIIPTVAVTVNADDDLLSRIMSHMQPDYLQCQGDESPERLADIYKQYGVKIIKSCPVATLGDLKQAEIYSGVCDFLHYDAKPPKGDAIRGGHGQTFDWSLLGQMPLPKYYALAGGLNPDNAARAAALTKAPMLDVSSGVESAPGVKSKAKINAFMDALKYG